MSLDSWIYPAMERLHALGYLDTAFLGLRPWTRLSCLHMLEQSQANIFDGSDSPGNLEARQLFNSLAQEFSDNRDAFDPSRSNAHAEVDRLYERTMYIGGRPINDSSHFGSTIINDYGRAYEGGFNGLTGFSARAEDARLSLNVRGEFQHAPGRAAYPLSVRQAIAGIDQAPLLPAIPVATTDEFRLIDANLSYHILNHEISVGKSENWWGPSEGGSFAWSNNAEPIYALRINRVEPLEIPLLSKFLGPFRYDNLFGSLKGHRYPNAPWVYAQKISFKPTPNLEFGFSRITVFAGEGHVPLTFGTFVHSFFSFQNVPPSEKLSTRDPGARHSSFDFNYRLPYLRNWVTLYSDSIIHDDVSPVDAPRHAAINPGVYISHFPGAPHLDFRAEAVSTDPPTSRSVGGTFLYWEAVYKDVYTNKGYTFGNWIGREGKGGQAWLTWWLSPQERIQLSYRNAKSAKDFVPGGTTQNLIAANAILRVKHDVEVNALAQYERWTVPVLAPGQKSDFTTSVQVTWFPHLRAGN
ncbi:MAG TPA: capsule assembly Wzi family protein [Acidobacteriaceae bacterium]|nr:capsule assembly Wzi family protein [Acidobacteriaceae bacterium]